MISSNPFSNINWLTVFFLLLPLFASQLLVAQNNSDKQKIKEFAKQVRKITQKKNFNWDQRDLSVSYDHEDNNVSYVINGKATLFDIKNVEIEAEVGVLEKYVKVTAIYPEDPRKQVKLDGQPVSDWLPQLYQNQLELKKQEFTLYPPLSQIKNKYKIKSWYEQPEGKPYVYKNCELDSTALLITLDKDKKETGRKPVKTLKLSGHADIGGADFSITGEQKFKKKECEWEIGASRDEIAMNELISALERYNRLELPGIPEGVREVTVEEPEVNFNNDKALTVSGITAIGKIEAMVVYASGSKNDFLLGYSPEDDCSLANINPNLKYFDGLELNNLALVYAYSPKKDKEISLGLLEDMEFASEKVKPGLVVLGRYDMPDGIPLLEKIDTVTLRADVPSDKTAEMALAGKIDLELLDLGVLKVSKAWVSLEPESKKSAIGMSVEGDIPELSGGKDKLALSGETEMDKKEKELALVLMMEDGDYWDTPFGFPGTRITNFGLEAGASGPDKKIGVRGEFLLGNLAADVAGFFDSKEPKKSMISVRSDRIDLDQLLRDFFDKATLGFLDNLPKGMLPVRVDDAELTLIPSPMTIVDKPYDPGLRITGDGKVFYLTAELDLLAAYDKGVNGYAQLDPISFPASGMKIIDLGGEAFLDFTTKAVTDQNHAFLTTKGKVALLGFSQDADIKLTKNGYSFFTSGRLFNSFGAGIVAEVEDLTNPKNMKVKATMEADFLSFFNKSVQDGLNGSSKYVQGSIIEARKTLKLAENAVEAAKALIPDKEEAISTAEEGVKAADEVVKGAKGVVADAEDKLRRAKKEVKKAQSTVNSAENEVKKWVDKIGDYLEPLVPGWVKDELSDAEDALDEAIDKLRRVENLKGKAQGVLDKAKDELKRVEELKKVADNELSGAEKALKDLSIMIDLKETAEDIAQNSLHALENGSDKVTKVAMGFLDDAGNVIKVNQASFEGKLPDVSDGQVDMNFSGRFLGQNFSVALPFNFSAPMETSKALMRHLLGI